MDKYDTFRDLGKYARNSVTQEDTVPFSVKCQAYWVPQDQVTGLWTPH